MKFLHFDLRALALMRFCISAVIMLDLSVRLGDLEAFYSDTGAVPLAMIFEHAWNDYFISIHTISGLWQVQLILFMLAYLFAIMLFIGYRTRLFTFLSWFMMLSLHNRNSLVLQGGDDLLRMTLFWAIFLPWGARYSCDAILSQQKRESNQIITVATIAYLLQISYIYTGSALLKGHEWNSDFTAMYYVYGLDQIVYPHSKVLFYYPELLTKLTCIAYYFELLVPILFVIPIRHQWFRLSGVALIILFHTINLFTLFIGLFPLIGISTCLGILPSIAMDKFEKVSLRVRSRVRDSFFSISLFVQHFIRWRPPLESSRQWIRNTATASLVFLLLYVFDWNLSNIEFVTSRLSDKMRVIGYVLRLDQNWGMFAPGVFKDDGWYILEGVTDKDKVINVFSTQCKGEEKPRDIPGMFRNDRWRKYSENMILTYNSFMRGYFCNYYKRIWNESHSEKITTLRIIYMSEFTQPDYKYSSPSKEILWECD
jgi:hypothetical protein